MKYALILLTLAPLPVVAQQFQPPAGCAGFLTVQSRTCRMSNYWTCPAETRGDKWRVDIGPNGPAFVSRVNNEAEWVESYSLFPTRRTRLVSSKDAMSMSELLDTGVDTYDFVIARDEGTETITGFDRVSSPEIKIDDEPLLPTTYTATATLDDGTVEWKRDGREYISARHRMFFSGSGITTRDGDEIPYDFSPVEFIYPGEPGFFANRPKYGCESLSAGIAPGLEILIPTKADPLTRSTP